MDKKNDRNIEDGLDEKEKFEANLRKAGRLNDDPPDWASLNGGGSAAAMMEFLDRAETKHMIGDCFHDGTGIEKDLEEAKRWYRDAVWWGDNTAYEKLIGQGRILDRYKKAAERGIPMFLICSEEDDTAIAVECSIELKKAGAYNVYARGNGRSYKNMLLIAEKAGMPAVENRVLAKCIFITVRTGEWISKELTQAMGEASGNAFEKISAKYGRLAEDGNAEAQYRMGCYANDPSEAYHWHMKSAKQGHAPAQYAVGKCHEEGYGVAENKEEAVRWWEKAAMQGDVYAGVSLGNHYFNAADESDYEKAFGYFRAAGENGYDIAQFNAGFCCENGYGTRLDEERAFAWYLRAAEQGYRDAQYKIGCFYYHGSGVREDKEEALRWFLKSADQEQAQAQCAVGLCLRNGEGTQMDERNALQWLKRAMENGIPYEQFIIGE